MVRFLTFHKRTSLPCQRHPPCLQTTKIIFFMLSKHTYQTCAHAQMHTLSSRVLFQWREKSQNSHKPKGHIDNWLVNSNKLLLKFTASSEKKQNLPLLSKSCFCAKSVRQISRLLQDFFSHILRILGLLVRYCHHVHFWCIQLSNHQSIAPKSKVRFET